MSSLSLKWISKSMVMSSLLMLSMGILFSENFLFPPAPDYTDVPPFFNFSVPGNIESGNSSLFPSDSGVHPYIGELKNNTVLLDSSIDYQAAVQSQFYNAVVFGNTYYLVVWSDDRKYPPWRSIYATRFLPDGGIVDTSGIHIFSGIYTSPFDGMVSVSFGDSIFLIVWSWEENIYGMRVNEGGSLMDSIPIVISEASGWQRFPSVAYDGNNFFVVWQDIRNGESDIYGARVTPEGTVIDTLGIPICVISGSEQSTPSVAFDGTNYMVVWRDNRSGNEDIYGARITPSGVVIDTNGFPVSEAINTQQNPKICAGNNRYLVVWQDFRNDNYGDIYGARVNFSGEVIDTQGILVSAGNDIQTPGGVVFANNYYFVVSLDRRDDLQGDIFAIRVDTTGNVIDSQEIVINAGQWYQTMPSVSSDGRNFLAVWVDYRNTGRYFSASDIYASRVDSSGNVVDSEGILVSNAGFAQRFPSVAFDGTNYMVVWLDFRSGESDIYGLRVDSSGKVLDSLPIPVSVGPWISYPSPSAKWIAYDGNNYFAVWMDSRNGVWDIYGARISSSGEILDPQGIPISTGNWSKSFPSVVFGDSNYFVVWGDWRNGNSDIYGARVTPEGVVLDPEGIPVSVAPEYQGKPYVTFAGTNYFVVWEDNRNTSGGDIYGARVSLQGEVLDTNGIPVSTAPYYQIMPSVSSDGDNFLVVWSDYRNNSNYEIYGARVTHQGTVIDTQGIKISDNTPFSFYPDVAFVNNNYVVVWACNSSPLYFGGKDIHVAIVDTGGSVLNTSVFASGVNSSPSVEKGSGNRVFISYTGFVDYILDRRVNTYRIWGGFYLPVSVAEYFRKSEPSVVMSFNSKKIRLFLPSASFLRIKFFDPAGRKVYSFTGNLSAGHHVFFLKNLKKGVYFGMFEINGYRKNKKFLIIK